MDELFHYLDGLHPLADELKAALLGRFTKETYRKHRTLLKVGETCDWLAFIEAGLVKTCYDRHAGDERIIGFGRPGHVTCGISSFVAERPSAISIVAIDETTVRKIRKNELEAICARYPAFNVHIRRIIERQTLEVEEHFLMFRVSSRERFDNLMRTGSWLLNDKRIPNYMVASYLGIDRATLSRLKHSR